MPRIRTLKPEFWSDEKLSHLPVIDRLVFLGLISMADDAGRLLDNPKIIDAFIFPNSDDTARESVTRLAGIGRLMRGTTVSGQPVIQIVNWARHQKIDHPNKKAVLPEVEDYQEVTAIRESLANDSRESRESLARVSREPREGFARVSRESREILATIPVPVPVPVPTTSTSTNDQRPTTDDPALRALFEEAWRTYPKRPGNPKGKAWKAWQARIKAGESAEAMLAGVQQYAAFVAREQTPPRFIKHAATFFGETRPYLDDYGPAPARSVQLYDPDTGDITPEAAKLIGLVA